jgi:hypothetical protein
MRYDWPDFVHIDYGLPLKWATHTLVTIAARQTHGLSTYRPY